ncbi:MAG: 30S ribosomal protein S1, partial [Paenibacillus sp. RIFOXYA1_FULL_44_5]
IIPLRELSSVHLDNPADSVQVDQELELKVTRVDDEKERLELSKRAVDSEGAWDKLQQQFESGEIFEGKVAEVVKGGLVIDVGVRGFIPASMVERHFVEDFSDYKGRTLRLKVKEIDREKNKVILSQKDVLDQEYEQSKKDIFSGLQVGQVLPGTVQRLTNFGAFVDIGGIDGLVHISEIAWNHVEKPSDVLAEGDQVKVQVLKLDPEHERISLSIKSTLPGPWEQASEKLKNGEIVEGTVKRLVSFGAFVEVAPGVEGLVHISQISHQHIGTPHEVLNEGQKVNVKILELNVEEKRVSLSIKETEEAPAAAPRAEKQKHEKEIIPEHNNQSFSLTLGERFGDKLNKFK